ncbi:hypothetical protein Purlil1_14372 [Purpureocillium lilacinum]|uniref:Uncharacterized protein n=1 Tax=Purpureocillium lilacinum TaxID=33203 RepID=A0ABR0BBG8_PURLI|nr:hypothetical protein Purlil1_14372 [Purpureocillium lilacinum]
MMFFRGFPRGLSSVEQACKPLPPKSWSGGVAPVAHMQPDDARPDIGKPSVAEPSVPERDMAVFARAVRQAENPHHRRACPTQPQQMTMSRRAAVMDAGHRRPDGPERAAAGSSKQGGPVACPPKRARRPAGAGASGAGPDPVPLPAVRRSPRRRKPSKPDPSAAQTPRRPCTSPPAAPRVRSPKSGRATTRSARQKSSRRPAKASAQRGPQPRTYRVNRLLGRYGHRLLILWSGGSTSLGTTKDIVDKGLLKDLTKDYTGLGQGVDLLDWRRGKNGRANAAGWARI